MKQFLYIILIYIVFFIPTYVKADNINKELNTALRMMLNKDPSCFNVLERICKEKNNEKACLGVGYCYMYGIGTYFEVGKAQDIFKYYIQSKNQSISRDAKVCLALLYENGIVDGNNLNIAASIWKELLSCNDNDIVNMAKSNLYLLNIGALAIDIIQNMILFGCDKISFEELRNRLNNKEFSKFPKNIFNIYVEWRSAFLNSYKSNGDKIKSVLKNIANGVIKGFLRDPSLITDTLKEQDRVDNEQRLSQYADQLWIDFISIIQNEGVQEMWLNWAQVDAIGYCSRK